MKREYREDVEYGSMLEAALKNIVSKEDREEWKKELLILADMLEEDDEDIEIVWTIRWIVEHELYPGIIKDKDKEECWHAGWNWCMGLSWCHEFPRLPEPLNEERIHREHYAPEYALWVAIIDLSDHMKVLWSTLVPKGYSR